MTADAPALRMSEKEIKLRLQCRDNFEFFCERCLKVRTKSGQVVPFRLNRAQRYILRRIREQIERIGYARINILKGRQQGVSTLIAALGYHATTQRRGVRAFILAHEKKATKNLFEMVERYHEHNNMLVKPETGAANANELLFPGLGSGYSVGTAGAKSTGRGQTIQFFHGSEVAFWPNASEHAQGIEQAIPSEPGTVAIRESTAYGVGNFFHEAWKRGECGDGEYENVFVPWYWQEEYRAKVPEGFQRTADEDELIRIYGEDGLDSDAQLQWRRNKVAALAAAGGDGETGFQQEYPNNSAEAFQASGGDGLIPAKLVLRARKNRVTPSGAFVVGVDPARGGEDRFSTICRMGRKAWGLKSVSGKAVSTLGQRVAKAKALLDTVDPVAGKRPDKIFIDAGGGDDLVDRLHELSTEENDYVGRVVAVGFGTSPFNDEKYNNKRSEMYGECHAWLADEAMPPEIPDVDSLQADLCASLFRRDSNDRICLLPKDQIKRVLGFSPDESDALVLTFAEPVSLAKPRTVNIDDYMPTR